MRSSRWQAHGNVYLVVEDAAEHEAVRRSSVGTDGILEVGERGQDWLEIVIWNPDGSLAEMSGNGTRIAARWLAEQTGAAAVTRTRRRAQRRARMPRRRADRAGARLGRGRRTRAARRASASSPSESGTRTRSSRATRPSSRGSGRCSSATRASRAHERAGRRAGSPTATIEARVWERGVGETDASGSSAVAVVAALRRRHAGRCASPAASCACASRTATRRSPAPPSAASFRTEPATAQARRRSRAARR